MISKYLKKIRNRSTYLAHFLRHGGSCCGYTEFIRTEFDRRYGVETTDWVQLEDLEASSAYKTDAGFYIPSSFDLFPKMLRASRIDPASFTFIDLGCGKGRMLIQAAESGFRRVEGVEFCAKLSQRAKQNLEIYQKRCNPRSPLTVHHLDATEFKFPNEPLVLFFFNAFQGAALQKVLENLDRSLKEFPRDLFFFWNGPHFYPESIKIMEGCHSLKVHTQEKDFAIYRSSEKSPSPPASTPWA